MKANRQKRHVSELAREVLRRPPVLEAARCVGLSDSTVARALGAGINTVHMWAHGRKMPVRAQLILMYIVGRLSGQIGKDLPPASRYALRARLRRDTVRLWIDLARQELAEETEDTYFETEILDAVRLGEEALRRLGIAGTTTDESDASEAPPAA